MWKVGWHLISPFDLLTSISIGIIYSSRTIYLPSLKLLGQSVLELSVAQGVRDWHDLWPTDINWDHLIIRYYLHTEFEALLIYQLHNSRETDMTFDLDFWPTDLNINREQLLIKDYPPTKFEASGTKRSWVISCTRYGQSTWSLTLTFDLLTWEPIGVIHLSWTIYLSSLKLVGQTLLSYQLHIITFDLTKFEASGAECSWVISCTRLRETDIPTDRQTDGRTSARGHKNCGVECICTVDFNCPIYSKQVKH